MGNLGGKFLHPGKNVGENPRGKYMKELNDALNWTVFYPKGHNLGLERALKRQKSA